jgi:hypothetical protein
MATLARHFAAFWSGNSQEVTNLLPIMAEPISVIRCPFLGATHQAQHIFQV